MDASTLERVDALWFPDGNIILSAHGGVLFRVFRGILAARSPVFADMLVFPPRPEADASVETLDGCPVLHLDDSAADAMYFLKALFDYEFFAPYPARTDFDAIHGVLRLGTKYRVEPLRRRALRHLASAHPMRLGVWDVLCGASSAPSPSPPSSSLPTGTNVAASAASSASSLLLPTPPSSTVGVMDTDAEAEANGYWGGTTPYAGPSFDFSHLELPILTLARAAGASWILPTAFLRASAALTGGVSLSSLDVLEGIDYTGVHVELARGDKVTLLESPGALLGEPVSDVLGFLWSPGVCPGCIYAQAAPSPQAASPAASSPGTGTGAPSTPAPPAASSTSSTSSTTSPSTAGLSLTNPCTANRLAMRVAAERWRADSLLPIAVGLGAPAGAGLHAHAADSAALNAGAVASGSGGATEGEQRDGDADADADAMDETETEAEVDEGGRAIWGEEVTFPASRSARPASRT
ncbi:hypothetical protein C8F04DRAFT_744231 [Mycena alexandri]|uniref:BTB domain-containing protein n=1 Tax=Mycena alexandri TaxID=1745969 RepID=A0AAD6WYX7_9AGAR|nr:hypothetical protein C8F04DRAFT_744231 [Mycena alexandri]